MRQTDINENGAAGEIGGSAWPARYIAETVTGLGAQGTFDDRISNRRTAVSNSAGFSDS